MATELGAIEVSLTANTAGLVAGLGQAQQSVNALSDTQRQGAETTRRLGDELERVSTTTTTASAATQGLGRSSSLAQQIGIGLGRTLQDTAAAGLDLGNILRYSGNNAIELAGQFSALRAEGAAAGLTLRQSLAGAFTGTGGVVLAVGAAVAILPALISYLGGSEDASQGAASAARELSNAYQSAVDAAVDLSTANLEVIRTARQRLDIEQQYGGLRTADLSGGLNGLFGPAGSGRSFNDRLYSATAGVDGLARATGRLTTARDGLSASTRTNTRLTGEAAEVANSLQTTLVNQERDLRLGETAAQLRERLGLLSPEDVDAAKDAARDAERERDRQTRAAERARQVEIRAAQRYREQVAEVYSGLQQDLARINLLQGLGTDLGIGITARQAALDRVRETQQAIRQLFDLNKPANDPGIQQLTADLRTYQDAAREFVGIRAEINAINAGLADALAGDKVNEPLLEQQAALERLAAYRQEYTRLVREGTEAQRDAALAAVQAAQQEADTLTGAIEAQQRATERLADAQRAYNDLKRDAQTDLSVSAADLAKAAEFVERVRTILNTPKNDTGEGQFRAPFGFNPDTKRAAELDTVGGRLREITPLYDAARDAARGFADASASAISQGLVDTGFAFVQILFDGEGGLRSLGEAAKAFGQSMVSALRDVLVQLGQVLIKALIVKGILALVNGSTGGVGGFLLDAFGGAGRSGGALAVSPSVSPAVLRVAADRGTAASYGRPSYSAGRRGVWIPEDVLHAASQGGASFVAESGRGV